MNVTSGEGQFVVLDNSVKKAFSTARATYMTYRRECDSNSMLYAAHILDPRSRISLISTETDSDQLTDVLSRTKAFFTVEWPNTTTIRGASSTLSLSSADSRLSGISSAAWRQIQARTRTREAKLAIPISEYER